MPKRCAFVGFARGLGGWGRKDGAAAGAFGVDLAWFRVRGGVASVVSGRKGRG